MQLVLSLFPGIDMLGMGFEREGFCVVRGPDIILGGDIRQFYGVAGRFDGVIGGSPCQDFSRARRTPPTGYGIAMLNEFVRVVGECSPDWFLLENVERVPDIAVQGYTIQRFDLNARECGSPQNRHRHFQFGSKRGLCVSVQRCAVMAASHKTCLASEGRSANRRSWGDFCELQGLPRDFDLPSFTITERYRAVGNGVALPMAQAVARAIYQATTNNQLLADMRLCGCGCGRQLHGRAGQKTATPACRKRLQKNVNVSELGPMMAK